MHAMPILTDYLAAAKRHHADGNSLASSHPPLADHILGIAAECALKAILVHLNFPLDKYGNLKFVKQLNAGRGHLPGFLAEFRILQGNPYVQDLPQPVQGQPDLFSEWSIHDRYSDASHIDAARIQRHQQDHIPYPHSNS